MLKEKVTISIRRAVLNDLERIVQLSNNGGPDGAPRQTLLDNPIGYQKAFKRLDTDPNQALMVVDVSGSVVGTFHLTFLTYLAGAGREDCQIEAVHVDSEWRNLGIGWEMMQWAINTAKERGCRRLQLTSNKRRKDAHRFYQRLGFVLSHEGAKLVLTDEP